jgi:hypothetical protein
VIELIAASIRYPALRLRATKNSRCAGTNIFPAQRSVNVKFL